MEVALHGESRAALRVHRTVSANRTGRWPPWTRIPRSPRSRWSCPARPARIPARYPSTLVRPDWNNVSPRVGAAWRANNRSTVRFGYGLTYNSGTYATIAKRLYSQAPSFVNLQATGSVASPLTLATALVSTPGRDDHRDLRHRPELPARHDSPVQRRLRHRRVQGLSDRRDLGGHARDAISISCSRPTRGRTVFGWRTCRRSNSRNPPGARMPTACRSACSAGSRTAWPAPSATPGSARATTRRRRAAAPRRRRTSRTSTPSGGSRPSIGRTPSTAA